MKKWILILALALGIGHSLQALAATVSPEEQILQLTEKWLGTPYGVGPLGEGRDGRYDQDPLYRFDQFDCVTFVETAIASVLVSDFDGFKKRMNEIRYLGGKVDYTTRNHFTEVDWIPNNIKNGILFDVMGEVEKHSKAPIPIAIAEIDKKHWYEKKSISEIKLEGVSTEEKQSRLLELQTRGREMPVEISKLPYIPFSEFTNDRSEFTDQILATLPHVLVLSVVRPGWDLVAVAGTQLNVTHQGLLLKIDGKWVVRHASSDKRYRVVQDDLEVFLKNRQKVTGIKGIHIAGVSGVGF